MTATSDAYGSVPTQRRILFLPLTGTTLHGSPDRRVRPFLLVFLAGVIGLIAVVYAYQYVDRWRGEADLEVASSHLAQARWEAPFVNYLGELCPHETRCFRVDADPQPAIDKGLDVLEAAGLRRDFVDCNAAPGGSCSGHVRAGKAVVSLTVVPETPARSGSFVMISEAFLQ